MISSQVLIAIQFALPIMVLGAAQIFYQSVTFPPQPKHRQPYQGKNSMVSGSISEGRQLPDQAISRLVKGNRPALYGQKSITNSWQIHYDCVENHCTFFGGSPSGNGPQKYIGEHAHGDDQNLKISAYSFEEKHGNKGQE